MGDHRRQYRFDNRDVLFSAQDKASHFQDRAAVYTAGADIRLYTFPASSVCSDMSRSSELQLFHFLQYLRGEIREILDTACPCSYHHSIFNFFGSGSEFLKSLEYLDSTFGLQVGARNCKNEQMLVLFESPFSLSAQTAL